MRRWSLLTIVPEYDLESMLFLFHTLFAMMKSICFLNGFLRCGRDKFD